MSIHPSLATSEKDKKQRSVLKRTERIRMMQDKESWKEGDKVYGLPKIKTIRIKIKKEKAEKVETATGTTPGAGETAASPKEGTTAAKTTPKGQQEKK